MLQTYSYPGNVRELENMVERAVLMARGRVIMPIHFPQMAGLVDLHRAPPDAKPNSCRFRFTKPSENLKKN